MIQSQRPNSIQRHVVQGEFEVANDPEIVLTTVLGSCVACCIHDTANGIGGMNHFLLPDTVNDVTGTEHRRYGVHLMELLLNELYKRGARRETLEVKIFGGANVVPGLTDIGAQNAQFAKRFLAAEEIRCVGGHTGGEQSSPRTVLAGLGSRKAETGYQRSSANKYIESSTFNSCKRW